MRKNTLKHLEFKVIKCFTNDFFNYIMSLQKTIVGAEENAIEVIAAENAKAIPKTGITEAENAKAISKQTLQKK